MGKFFIQCDTSHMIQVVSLLVILLTIHDYNDNLNQYIFQN